MATKKVAAKQQEKKKNESKSLYLRGILTEAMFGRREFKKGSDSKDKYRIGLKIEPEDMKKLIEEAEPFYEDTDDAWIPKWFKDKNAREFLNLSSNYDLKIGVKEDGQLKDLGTMWDYIQGNGNINGSKVVILVTLKPGAIYPQAILIKELHQTNIEDLFDGFMETDGDDELPFN